MSGKKNPIVEFPNGVVNIRKQTVMEIKKPWDFVIDCVDYPVSITPLYHVNDDGDNVRAEGKTNTMRDIKFSAIVVDRSRDGTPWAIATVTELYDTLPTSKVYESLRRELEEVGIEAEPVTLYVSGNGGSQELNIQIPNMDSPHPDLPIRMMLTVNTSVDGTRQHQIRLSAWNDDSAHEIVGIASADYSMATKHTRAIDDRHVSMVSVIEKLVTEWNNTIIPMMRMMFDNKFDAKFADSLFEELMADAKIPEMHIKALKGNEVHTADNMFDMVDGISEYFSEQTRPERVTTFKKNLRDSVAKLVKKRLATK